MTVLREQQLTFTFDDHVQASSYDDWSFYRNTFNGFCGGTKAADFICVDAQQTWIVEVKDYRQHPRTKALSLGDEVAAKVRDTLAGLAAASYRADEADEKRIARKAVQRPRLRVVLHLEQPRNPSKLYPLAIKPADILMKLRQCLRAVDPHPKVVNKDALKADMPWTVTGNAP